MFPVPLLYPDKDYDALKVGPLLYAPAANNSVAKKLINGFFPNLRSIAFCLEDAICDDTVRFAEMELYNTLERLCNVSNDMALPMIFIRIRNPKHLQYIFHKLSDMRHIVTGFILPKFDMTNCDSYMETIAAINGSSQTMYVMPILESQGIASVESRVSNLANLHQRVVAIKDYILNIRVGGNDFCNIFGLRRSIKQTIYDIVAVRDILGDILNIFGRDYVVSGPVWEYFDCGTTDDWEIGLEREADLDVLNGFIGKTAIHPSQLPVIERSLQVNADDYNDAMQILNWETHKLGVCKSSTGQRMNEVKTHKKWALRIVRMASIYGIRGDDAMRQPLVN